MKNLFDNIREPAVGLGIGIAVILALGGDPFFGFFAEREERSFPICQRVLYTYYEDLEFKQSNTPVQHYEVVCGYVAGIGGEYGTLREERQTFEDGMLISTDNPMGWTYTVECVRYRDPPQARHSYGWLVVDGDLYCKMPTLGVPPPRD